MLSITLYACLAGMSHIGPAPEAPPSPNRLHTGTMIDIPDNARVRGADEPAITVVGGADTSEVSPSCVELGAFGRPIITRSDLLMRSFDKGVDFTIIHYPHAGAGGFGHGHHHPPPASAPRPTISLETYQPIESRFPPSPGR